MAWLLIALLAGAGLGKALADALAHGAPGLRKYGPAFRNETSWQNKYRDYAVGDLRPKFWGATTVFVFATDAWHAANAVTWLCADAALLLAAWPHYRWGAVAAVAVRRCIFQPAYALLRK